LKGKRFWAAPGAALAFLLVGCGGRSESIVLPNPAVIHPAAGTSIAAAVAELPDTGGSIYLGLGTYRSGFDNGTVLTKQNVKIYCTKVPGLNDPTAPTALMGGTIIQGEFDVAGYSADGSANGFEMHDCGIDVGEDVVKSLYGGTPHNGLAIANVGQATGVPQTNGVVVDGVIALGYQNNSPVHALLFENLNGAYFAHLYSYLNGIGQVFKVTNSQIQDIRCSGESKCVYIKSDTYAHAGNVSLSGLTASYLTTPGDTGGLNVDAGSASLDGVQLSNVNFRDTTAGVSALMDSANGLYVNDVTIDGFTMDDGHYAATTQAPCFFFYSTGTSSAYRWKINNATCNNVAQAVWMTSNDLWQDISFSNFIGSNFNSGIGMALSGQNISVSNASFNGLGTGYGILAEGTSATTVNICNVSVNAGANLFEYVYIDSSPTITECGE
jgi:hypothetical protein